MKRRVFKRKGGGASVCLLRLDLVFLEVVASFVQAIVVPSDEKEREWWEDPMNQLEFLLTKTYLKEFIMFEEDNPVANVV